MRCEILTAWNEAETSLREALRLSPDFANAHHELGSVLDYLGRFAVQPPLVRLLSRLPGVSEIITQDGRRPSFDLWCALMSLPHAVGTTLETIPAITPYLTADPADVAHWRERLAGLAGLRVGLCWAGGRSDDLNKIAADRRRSITLDTLALLGEISGVQIHLVAKRSAGGRGGSPATRHAASRFHRGST